MSKTGLEAFVNRWLDDEAFRVLFVADPHRAMAGFELTPDESAAILSRDPGRVSHLGLDGRITKGILAN